MGSLAKILGLPNYSCTQTHHFARHGISCWDAWYTCFCWYFWRILMPAGGIGHCLVEQFAAQGCRVFATARRLEAMQSLKQLPGVELLHLDVCSSDSIKSAVAAVASEAGGIDILVRGQCLHGPTAHQQRCMPSRATEALVSQALYHLCLFMPWSGHCSREAPPAVDVCAHGCSYECA